MSNKLNIFPDVSNDTGKLIELQEVRKANPLYLIWKRSFDLTGALVLFPVMVIVGMIILVANQRLNPGPLIYIQTRMGKDCKPFRAFKFRTMVSVDEISRGAFDELEHDRIKPFGRLLRRTRVDELPQILNVIRGDMSLIGPRPDFYDHAVIYINEMPGYRERHYMRPGITGYAQIRHGYIEGLEGLRMKVAADLQYISGASALADLKITWATIKVIVSRHGK